MYEYKIKVKGPRNACYAFMGSTKSINEPTIISEIVNDKETIIVFCVDSYYPIDMYCHDFKGNKPVVLPDGADIAFQEAKHKYLHYSIKERSEMFDIEVWCNGGSTEVCDNAIAGALYDGDIVLEDLKDYTFDPYIYEHHNCGNTIYDKMPKDIAMVYDIKKFEDLEGINNEN